MHLIEKSAKFLLVFLMLMPPLECLSPRISTRRRRVSANDKMSIRMVSTAAACGGEHAFERALSMKKDAIHLVTGTNDFHQAIETIRCMISLAEETPDGSKEQVSECVEDTIRTLTTVAFARPHRGRTARTRITKGLEAIQLQLSSALTQPYDTVPRDTFMGALRALSGVISSESGCSDVPDEFVNPEAAFRILQRLLTGVGVRSKSHSQLSERDFNMVLNAVSNVGRMDVAHKVVAIQERHVPPLTPVTYSILLKGYGRLRDLENVEMILSHARATRVQPDIVMLNSIVDAYINCDVMDKAQMVFSKMKQDAATPPNTRTFNTLLKGHAKNGALEKAIALSNEMRLRQLWDDVTTNTLVSAAVTARDFAFAESLLANCTSAKSSTRKNHPNVEAYTELLDGYAKSGQLQKALGVVQIMRQRGVDPNSYTYTCMIGALSRARKVQQAIETVKFMESSGVKATVVTYNALISGLVASEHDLRNQDAYEYGIHVSTEQDDSLDLYVDQAIVILKDMIGAGVRPNVVTVAILIEALGRCRRPRIDEAETLVAKFEANRLIPEDNAKVKTAMIRACGSAGDLKAALNAFRGIPRPDVIAINAFMDAACRCGHDKFAFDTFAHFLSDNVTMRVEPDVISYSVLINALLKKNTVMGLSRAQKLYKQMRQSKIMPDTALVDIILTAMIRSGRLGLQKKDVQFTLTVLADAEGLKWLPGQFQRRKQAVRVVMTGRMSEIWKDNERMHGIESDVVDELFKKKGWNKVDSGFRLWGGGKDDLSLFARDDQPLSKKGGAASVDEFLAAKGWNDVDSSFRIW